MKTLEDAIEALALIWLERPDQSGINQWAYGFVIEMAGHIIEGKPLSVRQSESIINILKRYHTTAEFTPAQSREVLWLANNPVYRNEPVVVKKIDREVRVVQDNILAFKFAFNNVVKDQLKALKPHSPNIYVSFPLFVPEYKLWLVSVDAYNYERVMGFIKNESFAVNDKVLEFFLNIANSINRPSEVHVLDDCLEVEVNSDSILLNWLGIFHKDSMIYEI